MSASDTLPVVAIAPEVVLDRAVEADRDLAAAIRRCESREVVLDLVIAGQVGAAVFGLLGEAGTSVVPFVAQARRRNPGVPIVVELPGTRAALRRIPKVLRAGASDVSVRGFDRLSDIIRMVLTPNWQSGAARALLDIVPPMVPRSLEAFAVACALKASPRLTVGLAADWAENSPRTIRSRLRRASLAPPLAFVKYCSAAHAMCLLYPQRLSPNQVVERMRFGSRRALHDLIHGYLGRPAEGVQKRWAYAALLLRPGEFLRRPRQRRPANVGLNLERLERYVNDELTATERIEFERWIAANAITQAGEARERVRQWSKARGLERDLRQRREETWVRLLRSIGSELDP